MTISEHRARGFTLLEMLVVLLVTGMALALASQALGQYQRAHQRISAFTQTGLEARMSEAWFRESVRGLLAVEAPAVPDTPARRSAAGPSPVFEGRDDGFSGVTLMPVLAGQGVPTTQNWRIERDARRLVLVLEEGDARLELRLPASRLQLHYLDVRGESHDRWPPAQGLWPQLPAVVLLEVTDSDGNRSMLAAAVAGLHDPLVLPYEPEPL